MKKSHAVVVLASSILLIGAAGGVVSPVVAWAAGVGLAILASVILGARVLRMKADGDDHE